MLHDGQMEFRAWIVAKQPQIVQQWCLSYSHTSQLLLSVVVGVCVGGGVKVFEVETGVANKSTEERRRRKSFSTKSQHSNLRCSFARQLHYHCTTSKATFLNSIGKTSGWNFHPDDGSYATTLVRRRLILKSYCAAVRPYGRWCRRSF